MKGLKRREYDILRKEYEGKLMMNVIIIKVWKILKIVNEIERKIRIKILIIGKIEEKGIEREILINGFGELMRIIDERGIWGMRKRMKRRIGIESIGLRIKKGVEEFIKKLGIIRVVERIGKEGVESELERRKGDWRKIVRKNKVKRNEMGF